MGSTIGEKPGLISSSNMRGEAGPCRVPSRYAAIVPSSHEVDVDEVAALEKTGHPGPWPAACSVPSRGRLGGVLEAGRAAQPGQVEVSNDTCQFAELCTSSSEKEG